MITYEGLPKSSGGAHVINENDMRLAWDKGNSFISKVSYELIEEKYILDVYVGCKEIRKYIFRLLFKFGLMSKVDFFGNKAWWYVRWNLSEKSASSAIEFISSITPLPEYLIVPIHLYREGQFLLKDRMKDQVLHGQEKSYDFGDESGHKTPISNFRLNFTNKVSISVWLVLPFEAQNREFHEYVDFLKEHTPFRFSDNHWRCWSCSKNNKLKSSILEW